MKRSSKKALLLAVLMLSSTVGVACDAGIKYGDEENENTSYLYVQCQQGGIGSEYLNKLATAFEEKFKDNADYFAEGKTKVDVVVSEALTANGGDLQSSIANSTQNIFAAERMYYFDFLANDLLYDLTNITKETLDDGTTIEGKLFDDQKDSLTIKNGKYYESESNSLIYADFTGLTSIFDRSIIEMIEMGGFDFSKSETDGEILAYMAQNDNDVKKTDEYLKKLWGEDYDANAEIYQLEDIYAGRYHGDGPDLTAEMRAYAKKIDKSGTEKDGCVVVDERLAELLQLLMDKYTFEGVDNSWIKLCYYYDNLNK